MLCLFDVTSPVWLLTAVFTLLPMSVSMMIVSETHGLNALPKEMYPHGTAIISTINPIAGAVGAAFFVGVTHIGEELYKASELPQQAMLYGVHFAFLIAIGMSVLTLWFANKLQKNR